MQALISSDLALCFEVYKVTFKTGDFEPISYLCGSKSSTPIKILVGWSTINLTATYNLSNMMTGQSYSFKKLRFFEPNLGKKGRVKDCFQQLSPDQVKQANVSALMT